MNRKDEIEIAFEDCWFALSDILDANIYIDDGGKLRICVYPVSDGITNTQYELATGIVENLQYNERDE